MSKHSGHRWRAAKKLPLLLRRSGHRCAWCGNEIVCGRLIRERFDVVKESHSSIWYKVNGEITVSLLATVDHVVPLSEDGSREIENLVAACHRCNQKRNREAAIENNKNMNKCRRCGRPKSMKLRRLCQFCRLGYVEDDQPLVSRFIFRGERTIKGRPEETP